MIACNVFVLNIRYLVLFCKNYKLTVCDNGGGC